MTDRISNGRKTLNLIAAIGFLASALLHIFSIIKSEEIVKEAFEPMEQSFSVGNVFTILTIAASVICAIFLFGNMTEPLFFSSVSVLFYYPFLALSSSIMTRLCVKLTPESMEKINKNSTIVAACCTVICLIIMVIVASRYKKKGIIVLAFFSAGMLAAEVLYYFAYTISVRQVYEMIMETAKKPELIKYYTYNYTTLPIIMTVKYFLQFASILLVGIGLCHRPKENAEKSAEVCEPSVQNEVNI